MSPKQTSNSTYRPPIVTVMGHIDHGKTSLLDKIRSTHIWNKEAGGITQHVAAYQVAVEQPEKPLSLITFIDTPGHAAFCDMRSRGAQITDIVVLVISAVEGIMPQTKECIEHIKKTNIPFVVALNKIDLDSANPDKVKGQLVEMGYTPEEYGGQIAVIPVSAKTGAGIPKLLEMIVLNAEVLELKSLPNVPLEAYIIESRLDKSRGPVATAIIKQGTLCVSDQVYAQQISCKVKALLDHNGKIIKSATPSTPVEILGFTQTPAVGAIITSQKEELIPKPEVIIPPPANPEIPQPEETSSEEVIKLPLVIKADVQGTLEALVSSLPSEVQLVSSGIGAVSENDVFLAANTKAQIFAFNTTAPKFIKNMAENEKVRIFESKIIYEIIENIQDQVLHLLEPTIDETFTGEGTIKAEFKINKVRIAGLTCTKGEIKKGDQIHLQRDGKITKDTKVDSIQQGKDSVEKVKQGQECGITFKPYIDFKVNDVIIAYKK